MTDKITNTVYSNLVRLTLPYLGPSSDRFISRQVRNHLYKEPEELKSTDIDQIIEWLKLAMSFLTKDQNLVNNYINEIKALRSGGV